MDIRGQDPQLGQYYIAEYATRAGYSVKIKRYSSNEPMIQGIHNILSEYNCDVLGFYVDSENIWTIRRVILALKKLCSNLFVIIGGPQVTGNPELAMKRLTMADCAIVGEGERPMTELLSVDFRTTENLKSIKGLVFSSNGKMFYTGSQIPVCNLDQYPFPRRELYTLDEGVIFDQISTGRGCVGKCAFCFEGSKKDNRLRLRSIENVIEEIDYVVSNLKDHPFISFLDDTFIINPDRTEAICNHLIVKYGGKIGWYCEARVDILLRNLHLLPLMKRAGLIRIQLGGESGSQRVLDAYNKGMKIDDLIYVVQKIYEEGISSVYINFIVGGAHETMDSFMETLDLAKKLLRIAPGCAEVGCSLFSPYVGTPMYDNPSLFGIKIIDRDLISGPDGYMAFVETEALSQFQILQLKDYFDAEILNTQYGIIRTLSKEQLLHHFELFDKYTMKTSIYNQLQKIESFKNYFEAVLKYGFSSIRNLSKEELLLAVPYRTVQPVSDGQKYLRLVGKADYKESTYLQNYIFLLSSGKLCFQEILDLLRRNEAFTYNDSLIDDVINVYNMFDEEHLVVWKYKF
ncbi:MAG: radical SAM protein [Erysipelotrichaceae bacterium]|nr:radical SAM protein [Erysipelotrichaceae bacterium]